MENELKHIYELAGRLVPWLYPQLVFHLINNNQGEADRFEIQGFENTLHISGTSIPALGMGLNYFLKYYCNRSASHCGDNLSRPEVVVFPEEKIIIATPFRYRYALNYCTFNYTMSFWKWDKWEKELDWMALNGVNLMLVTTGLRAVWQKVLLQCGYTNNEIHEFMPGPAFNAWWLMGNLEGWGGTCSNELINQQATLTKKILTRMRELGIEPVYHGFYGMIPRNMKGKFPGIHVLPQGKWNDAFERPDILSGTNALFQKIAGNYYNAIHELYGDIKFFGGDPFHEGGVVEDLDLDFEANAIYDAMQKAVPGSIWVLQAWYRNPRQELLDGLKKKEDVLILDLFGEVTHEWKDRNAFGHTPLIWCSINNFGERNGLYGRLEKIAAGPVDALLSSYKPFIKGIGAAPEGIHNNPVVYDMIFDAAWRPFQFNVKSWLADYTGYRYGKKNEAIVKAWDLLLKTVYSSDDKYREGSNESIFCARPSLKVTGASTWSTRYLFYNAGVFEEAVHLFLSVSDEFAEQETYRYDAIDLTRQMIANNGQKVYDELVKAFNEKNNKNFQKQAKSFLELILLQDELLSSHPAFMLGTWLQEAREFRDTEIEKDLCESNARILITWWGPEIPNSMLNNYAHKEWAGLLKDYYYPRWKIFLESLQWEPIGFEPAAINFFSFETNWTRQKNIYPVIAEADCIDKAREVLIKSERYRHAIVARN